MEVVITNHKDRCNLIHEIVSAPLGSRVVVITEPDAAIPIRKDVSASSHATACQ